MKNCLIVDDSRVIRMVASKIVGDLDFAPSEAEDGQAALASCRKAMPDAILLDWSMPVMSGVEFLRALRKERGGDKPLVFFCTGENDMSHINEALSAGANTCVLKPFDRETIGTSFRLAGLI